MTRSSVVISWDTDELADGQVEYGTSTSYGKKTGIQTVLSLNHKFTLKNLKRNTIYHFRVTSKDASGNLAIYHDESFTTLGQALTNAVVLPYAVAEGDLIKFNSKSTVYLVKPEGLYPFETYASYKNYLNTTNKRLRIIKDNSEKFTIFSDSAQLILEEEGSVLGVQVSLPEGVKGGDLVKFKDGPAIYLVQPDGLHTFASFRSYSEYLRTNKRKLKVLQGSVGSYTLADPIK